MDTELRATGIGLLEDISTALNELKEKPEGMTDKTYKTILDSLETHFILVGATLI